MNARLIPLLFLATLTFLAPPSAEARRGRVEMTESDTTEAPDDGSATEPTAEGEEQVEVEVEVEDANADWESDPRTIRLQKKEARRYDRAQAKRVTKELRTQQDARKRSAEGMLREDVLYVNDGSVYRGRLLDQQDIYRIQVNGGSIIAVSDQNVIRLSREERFAHETGHARQFGLRIGLGGVAGLSYPAEDEYFTTNETLETAFTYAPSHSFEVESSVLLKDDGWKGALGFRYFINPNQSVKGYQLTSVIVGGEKSALGLRLGNGVQWDLSRSFGLFVHHGATFYAQNEGVHIGYHVDIGTQFRR